MKYSNTESEYYNYKEKYIQLEQEIVVHKTTISEYDQRYQNTQHKHEESNQSLREVQQRIEDAQRENSALRAELNEEKERIRRSSKEYNKQLREYQRTNEMHLKSAREKEVIIEELKTKRTSFETDFETLRRETAKYKDDYRQVIILQNTAMKKLYSRHISF